MRPAANTEAGCSGAKTVPYFTAQPPWGGATEEPRGRQGAGRRHELLPSRCSAPVGDAEGAEAAVPPVEAGSACAEHRAGAQKCLRGASASRGPSGNPWLRALPALAEGPTGRRAAGAARHDAVGRSDSRRAEPSCLGSQPGGRSRDRRRGRCALLVAGLLLAELGSCARPRRTSCAPRCREARAQPPWASQGSSAPSQNSKRSLTHCSPPRTHVSAHESSKQLR